MSLYNMIFGRNPLSAFLLAILGLTGDQVGRFRDAYVTEGKIAIYTRNGGGNRECWHSANPETGSESCQHEAFVKTVKEWVALTPEEAAKHPDYVPWNVYVGNRRYYETGKMVDETFYRCLEPDSEKCACPGCIITHRLPKHPLYISDEDDDYDCTYATIYFRFPEQYAEMLAALEDNTFEPNQRWLDYLSRLQQSGPTPPEIIALEPLLQRLREALNENNQE